MFEGLTPEEIKAIELELSKLPPEQQGAARKRVESMGADDLKAMFKKSEQCIFCKIAAKEIPAKVVYEDGDVIAVLDINPANKGHVLVVPKQHVESFLDLSDALSKKLITTYKIIAKAVVSAVSADGFNMLENDGKVAGQVVPHVHMHIIPRHEGDGLSFNWNPKKFSEEELGALQKEIISNVKPVKVAPKKPGKIIKIKPKIPKY